MNWDYIAGFFDGEGCFISKLVDRKRKHGHGDRYTYPQIRISCAQSLPHSECLHVMAEFLNSHGVETSITTSINSGIANHKMAVLSVIGGKGSRITFLKNITDLLIVKRPAALAALEFQKKWDAGIYRMSPKLGVCVICGKSFSTVSGRRKYCEPNCRSINHYRVHKQVA